MFLECAIDRVWVFASTFVPALISLFKRLVRAGEDSRSALRPSKRPVVDPAQRAAHQLGAVANGQPVCRAKL